MLSNGALTADSGLTLLDMAFEARARVFLAHGGVWGCYKITQNLPYCSLSEGDHRK